MNNISKKTRKTWMFLLPLGIILIIMGIMQDGYHDTLSKAIMICLECIGIG